jgi:YidC/Oxa1 family membrane protein insertase
MAALLLVYQTFFSPAPDAPSPKPPAATPAGEAPSPAPAPAPSAQAAGGVPAAGPPPARPAAAIPERLVVVETPLYRASVSSVGGALRQWQLRYRGDKPMVIPGLLGPRGLRVDRAGAPSQVVEFAASGETLSLGRERPQGEVKLRGEDGFGLRLEETLRFHADGYTVEVDLRVENRHSVAQGAEIVIGWDAPVEWPKDKAEQFQGQHPTRIVGSWGGGVHRIEMAQAKAAVEDGQWVGVEGEWYLSALVPRSAGFRLYQSVAGAAEPGKSPREVGAGVRAALPVLQPGQSWEGKLLLYVGPKEYSRLKALGVGLEKSVFFGGFPLPQAYGGLPMEWVVVPVLWLMHVFYDFTRNYGVAIILLTIIAKVLFFPLSLKSMRSMKAMQAIQPQVNALRSKYRNDAQKIQQETMALYRQHGVNPLGGCLPMVVQIPIFYALYVALSVSVELQNAPFICVGRLFGMDLWICDLAAQDPTYVLPILMGVSMFVQQKMTPTMGDPRQAKMMLMMPVVFTFMFLNLPSGLVLYWTLSNVLQIGQQLYMDRDGKAVAAAPRATKKA